MTANSAICKQLTLANGSTVDVYMMPDGSFVYPQNSLASSAGNDDSHVRRFLGSVQFKVLMGKGFTLGKVKSGRVYLNAVPSNVVVLYWAYAGAFDLVLAYAATALDILSAEAFGLKPNAEELASRNYNELRLMHMEAHNMMQDATSKFKVRSNTLAKLWVLAVTGKTYYEVMGSFEHEDKWRETQRDNLDYKPTLP